MTVSKQNIPVHPGKYIKQEVLPPKLSIKKAAEMLGVGRPALSNLFNGKAALSPEMAMRLEKAFSADRTKLLEMQARFDEFESRQREDEIAVRAYALPFLQITARQIEAWSETLEARAQLGALLRNLVLSTGANFTEVDFPAFDNSQRRGWDGRVSSDSATPWIPRGQSGWEFGCDKDVRRKAEGDYQARTSSVPSEERKATTFVFVTPRNWSAKAMWIREKKALGEWKDVRAFDADDLEQWLEQSIPAQTRFREFQGGGGQDVCSLDEAWTEWADVTKPSLSKELFRTAAERHKDDLEKWFLAPPSRPFVVTADSPAEAAAFLACALEQIPSTSKRVSDRAVVIRSKHSFQKISKITTSFVPIIESSEVEQALGGLHKKTHTIIIRARSAVSGEPDIALGILDYGEFKTALKSMGFNDHEIERLARESGRSPTILRRRLAQIQAVKVPQWADDDAVARKLIPLMFVGAWDSNVSADHEVLHCLSGTPYAEVERTLTQLLRMNDSPVWSIGGLRGVVSKIDALYAVHGSVTREDIDNFFVAAGIVLSEEDPALELPEDKRWAANLYGKSRNHSTALREGICETLVLLSVHGNVLFRSRLGINLEAEVDRVIHNLLTPLTGSTWLSQKDDLPRYAEAAPDEFLSILEEDLRSPKPQVAALLEPADSGIFGGCPRTGLLWSLELLAWKPERIGRVTSILAMLCDWKIEDNWANKPLAVLESIFRFWMPQTAASVDERNRTLETLTRRFPEIGWQVCVSQFDPALATGHYNYRPRWRTDARGAGEVALQSEGWKARLKAAELVLGWPVHDENTLGDLVDRFEGLDPDRKERVWALISEWIATDPTDAQKATLRERVRRSALTRRSRKRGMDQGLRDRARRIYDALKPRDSVARHEWLFLRQWVDESADEIEDEDLDYRKREGRIARQRLEALREVWDQSGLQGIKALCRAGDASNIVGSHFAQIISDVGGGADFLEGLVSDQLDELGGKLDNCIAGYLGRLDPKDRSAILSELLDRLSDQDDLCIRLLTCAPFYGETWELVDKLPEDLRRRYWQDVHPHWGRHEEQDMGRLIDELLRVERPRAAFHAAHMDWDLVDTPRLVRLLTDVASSDAEPTGYYRIDPHYVSEALDELGKRGDSSRDDLARLEFMYIELLDNSRHGIRYLEERLSESPTLFVQALARSFRRSDGAEDPPELRVPNPDQREAVATASYTLLTRASRIPGTRSDGTIDIEKLRGWLNQARTLCRQNARVDIGDQMIGQLLSHCPAGDDGIWPCEPVREVIEEIGSTEIITGMSVGIRNARGAGFRGAGGSEERGFARKYRRWAHEIAFEYPFTASMLEQIARSYDREAEWWDTESSVRDRLEG